MKLNSFSLVFLFPVTYGSLPVINGARHAKIGKPETSLNGVREDSKTESSTDKFAFSNSFVALSRCNLLICF